MSVNPAMRSCAQCLQICKASISRRLTLRPVSCLYLSFSLIAHGYAVGCDLEHVTLYKRRGEEKNLDTHVHETCAMTAEEEAIEKIFEKHGLFYPVPITYEHQPPLDGYAWLKPSDFLRTMSEMNDMSHVLGGHSSVSSAAPVLKLYWERFQAVCPDHALFREVAAGHKQLEKCIPLLLHGDEGTTYKRGGVLIISFQGAFGYGCSKRTSPVSDGIPLNFLKTGFQTRLLSVVCKKDCMTLVARYVGLPPWLITSKIIKTHCLTQDLYADDRRVWNALMELVSADFAAMQDDGICLGRDGQVWPIVVGCKGDWSWLAPWSTEPFHHDLTPFQVSCANLIRSYRHAPKGAGRLGDHNVHGEGICHLCMCGIGVDWEDLRLGKRVGLRGSDRVCLYFMVGPAQEGCGGCYGGCIPLSSP